MTDTPKPNTTDLLMNAALAVRAEQDRRTADAAGKAPQSAAEIVAETESRMAQVQASHAEKRQRLREWLAPLPQTDVCPVHGCEREISLELSYETQCNVARKDRHEGLSNGTFFAEYACPKCEREATYFQWQRLGIPEKYWGETLDVLSYDTEKCREHLKLCRAYEANPRGFLLLLGNPGTGKTHAACAILGKHGAGWFTSQSDLIVAMRERYNNPALLNVRAKAITAPLLVIDEIGVASGGNDAATILFDVINARYASKRPLILTSNVPREELLRNLGHRVLDRIGEAAFAVLKFDEPSKRAQANERYLEGF